MLCGARRCFEQAGGDGMPLSSPLNPWGTQDGPEVGLMHPLPVSTRRGRTTARGSGRILAKKPLSFLGPVINQMLMQG